MKRVLRILAGNTMAIAVVSPLLIPYGISVLGDWLTKQLAGRKWVDKPCDCAESWVFWGHR